MNTFCLNGAGINKTVNHTCTKSFIQNVHRMNFASLFYSSGFYYLSCSKTTHYCEAKKKMHRDCDYYYLHGAILIPTNILKWLESKTNDEYTYAKDNQPT